MRLAFYSPCPAPSDLLPPVVTSVNGPSALTQRTPGSTGDPEATPQLGSASALPLTIWVTLATPVPREPHFATLENGGNKASALPELWLGHPRGSRAPTSAPAPSGGGPGQRASSKQTSRLPPLWQDSFTPHLFFVKIYLFLVALVAAHRFSRCSERGRLFTAVRGLLTAAASLGAEHRFWGHMWL